MKLTLKNRLTSWLQRNPGFHASGAIQRLVANKTDYTPRTVVRRLEELTQEGAITVEYRKGHAYYRFKGAKSQELDIVKKSSDWFDSLPSIAPLSVGK